MNEQNISVIVPGENGDMSQFVSMHSLIDAPSGFNFATDARAGVRIVRDVETHEDSLLVSSGSLSLTVPRTASRRHLTVYLKNLTKFTELKVEAYDVNGAAKTLTFGNHQSVVRIQPKEGICRLPMTLRQSWNHINIDLEDVISKAFGVGYSHTRSVSIHAHCAVWKVYFQDRVHTEAELPAHLKIS